MQAHAIAGFRASVPIEDQMANLSGERRKERRYIVAGVSARVDGEECPIADMSATAVRLLRPYDLAITRHAYTLVFTFDAAGETFTVSGILVRCAASCFVLRYDPPSPTWEALIRSADTFEQTRLCEIFG